MKILFITATRLGDAVLSSGLLDYMLRTWPESKVTVACGALPASIFEGFPHVESIISMTKKPLNGHWVALWRQVVGTQWDLVVDLRNSAVSRLVRVRQRHIFGKHIDKNLHKVEQMAAAMGLSEVPAPKLYFTPAQKKWAKELVPEGGPVLAVGPSANWIGKTWPAENFIALIESLTAEDGLLPGVRVAVFAAPGEEAQALPVLQSVPAERQINGIAKGGPGEVAAAISKCALYIGNDSGLMHIAAAAHVPTLGLFGPSYPQLYHPWGAQASYASTPQSFDELIDFEGYDPKTLDRTLMTGLSVEAVLSAIRSNYPNHRASGAA